jgi:hypothetical protein
MFAATIAAGHGAPKMTPCSVATQKAADGTFSHTVCGGLTTKKASVLYFAKIDANGNIASYDFYSPENKKAAGYKKTSAEFVSRCIAAK